MKNWNATPAIYSFYTIPKNPNPNLDKMTKIHSYKGKPTLVEMFSGAGLFSYAFVKEGFRVIKAVEIDKIAAATYYQNLSHEIEVGDVRKVNVNGNCQVLIAGSPCQGFSTLGKKDITDPRNFLSLEVLRWAKILKPQIIVVENVAAFLNTYIWEELKNGFNNLGYEVSAVELNSFDFNVPQMRRRAFTFATRTRLPIVKKINAPNISTVLDAWDGLSSEPDNKNYHYSPSPSELALARMKIVPIGGDKRDIMRIAPQLAPPSWWKVPFHVTDVWGRMHWKSPSNTIRTCFQNPSKGRYIHPEQNRVISIREGARLQSIPDEWQFVGTPTQITRQIGNSVPPNLGRAIARAVLEALN